MRWPLGGRRRGRPVLPTRHPAPPAAPPTQPLPPRPAPPPAAVPAGASAAGAPPTQPAPRTPAPPPLESPAPPAPRPATTNHEPVRPATPPAAEPPRGSDPAGRPATRDDISSLRRWLIVTAAWSVAATAIAVFAFITASDNDADAERVDAAAAQVQGIERRVNRRLESLSGQLESGPFTARVENLEGAIRDIRDLIATRDRQWKRFEARNRVLNGKITFLEQAVRDLQANQDAADQNTTP